jgi:hypothetical protein
LIYPAGHGNVRYQAWLPEFVAMPRLFSAAGTAFPMLTKGGSKGGYLVLG